MTLEITAALSVASVAFSVMFGLVNMKRNAKADYERDATQITTIMVRLETIGNDVSGIKSEVSHLNQDVRGLMERIVVVEQATKSAHKRIDDLQHILMAKDIKEE